MDRQASTDHVPSAALELISAFSNLLTDVQFPDLDLSTLEALMEELEESARELQAARAQVEVASNRVKECRKRLVDQSKKGLAYARIYAEGDPELTEALARISFEKSPKAGPKRRRRAASPPQAEAPTEVAELPFAVGR